MHVIDKEELFKCKKQKPETEIVQPFKKLIVIDITKENTIKSEFVREEKDLVEFMPCLEALPRFRRTAAAAGAALPPRDCDAHQQSVYTRARSSSANRMQFEITPLTMSAGRSPTHPSSQARRSPPPCRRCHHHAAPRRAAPRLACARYDIPNKTVLLWKPPLASQSQ